MSEQYDFETVWKDGCEQWIYKWASMFWRPYYVNIMFHPLSGSFDQILVQMRKAIEDDFYPNLIREFAHHPRATSEQEKLPKFKLFPDLSVWKKKKVSLRRVRINETLHYNGAMLIPPISKLKECPIELIKRKHSVFACGDICRVHIVDMHDVHGASDYSGKTVNAGRADEDNIILLPRGVGELSKKPVREDPQVRAIKDIQSRHNVSKEIARQMLGHVSA